jgi:predicted Zn-dependent protease
MIFMGDVGGFALHEASSNLIPVPFLQFLRKDVSEADYLAVQYLYKAGYDPLAAVHFLEELQALESGNANRPSAMFRTHPLTADRITATQHNVDFILPPRQQNVLTTEEFGLIKARVGQLTGQR